MPDEKSWLEKVIEMVKAQAEQNKKARWPGTYVPTRPVVTNLPHAWTQNEIDALKAKIAELAVNNGVVTNAQEVIPVPAVATDVVVNESPYKTADGSMKSLVSVTFTCDDPNFDTAQVYISGYLGTANPQFVAEGKSSPICFVCETTKEFLTVTVITLNSDGQYAPIESAPTATVTLDGVVSAPPAPTIASTLILTALGYTFSFNQLSGLAADSIDGYKVYRNTTNSFTGATKISYFKHDKTNTGAIQVQDICPPNNTTTYYYFVSSVNTTGLESTATAVGTAAKGGYPQQVTGVSATESPYKTKTGQMVSLVSVSFTPAVGDGYFSKVNVYFTGYHGNSNAQLMAEGATSPVSFLCETTNETVTVKVVAVGTSNNEAVSGTPPTTTVALDGVVSAPPAPTISQGLIPTPTGFQFSFTQLAGLMADIVGSYRVYRNTVDDTSTATLYQTFTHDGTNGGTIVVQDVQPYNTIMYYWVSSVNSTGLESTKAAAQTGIVYSGSKLDANGNVVSADMIAADGATFLRAPNYQGDLILLGNANFEASSTILPPPGWMATPGATTSYETASPQSGSQSVKIVATQQYAGIATNRVWKVNPGDTYFISGWVKVESGKTAIIQLGFTDGTNWMGQVNANTTSATWAYIKAVGVVPIGASQAKFWCISGESGTTTAYFDNISVFRCTDPANAELLSKGSVPPIFAPGLTYSSTTSSIQWSWAITGYRTDLNLTTFSANSSQNVTGLGSGSTYSFYPFYDETTKLLNMVSTGGVGTPAWAHVGTDRAWTAEQYRTDHIPLSMNAVSASTTSTGTGTGGGGGDGGCLRIGMFVKERTKGIIRCEQVVVGDELWSEYDTWLRVERVRISAEELWSYIEFNNGASVVVTTGHAWTLAEDRSMKRSTQLSMDDGIPCPTGVAFPCSWKFVREHSEKVSITCASPHLFYASSDGENWVLTHNMQAMTGLGNT